MVERVRNGEKPVWHRRTGVALAAVLLLVGVGAGAQGDRARIPAAQRSSWGRVVGWVLDARSRAPIANARVSVEIEGAFPESGSATDATDRRGRYQARAPLGKISSQFDWGRLLTMHPVSLLFSPRSLTKQTRILDLAHANVRVEAEGYRPFVGRVRASVMDPSGFSITLEDVWLARGKARPSRSPRNVCVLSRSKELKIEPAIAAPGEKVRISLATHLPLDRGHKYRAFVASTAIRLVENQLELKRERPGEGDEANRVVFSREVVRPFDRRTTRSASASSWSATVPWCCATGKRERCCRSPATRPSAPRRTAWRKASCRRGWVKRPPRSTGMRKPWRCSRT